MKKIIFNLIFCISTISSSSVFANATTLKEWGTVASVVSGDCTGNTCDPLHVFLNGMNQEFSAGGVNQLTATTNNIAVGLGNAKASASMSADLLATPILKAQSSSTDDLWLGAGAFAIQGYEYTGQVAKTIILDILFDGNITNPDADSATGFGVGMYLFTADQVGFSDVLADPYAVLGALALAANAIPLNQSYQLDVTNNGSISESGQLSILLAPGDQFYLAGGVLAAAGGTGAIADAFGTLSVGFQDTESLISASVSQVPLPSAIMFCIPALLSLLGFRKKTS